jgi:hypothetical protein
MAQIPSGRGYWAGYGCVCSEMGWTHSGSTFQIHASGFSEGHFGLGKNPETPKSLLKTLFKVKITP